VKTVKLFLFTATGGAVVGVYAVAPFALSLRPELGGLLLPAGLALVIVGGCALKIVTVLQRTAPFANDYSDLLTMPVIELDALERKSPAEDVYRGIQVPRVIVASGQAACGRARAGRSIGG